jgi:CheY-like chemotaxis protein
MFGWFAKLRGPTDLSLFDADITRERLIQNGRIVVIDDETPLLIDELRKVGFSVDHEADGNDVRRIDAQLYDVAIVDFHGVGATLGPNQGLDLLRHIRRVSPRTRVIAFTSRSLSAAESEFFRKSHVVLPKNLGLEESLSLIEEQLRQAFSKQHLYEALLNKLNVSSVNDRKRIQDALAKALGNRDEGSFKKALSRIAGQAAEKSVSLIIDRLFTVV